MQPTAPDLPYSEYAARNAAAILTVLRDELANGGRVLEIGSGTGQHAAIFAAQLPDVQWQPSDVPENLSGVAAWVRRAGLSNLQNVVSLDVRSATLDAASYDAVYSANTAHIMHVPAVERMICVVSDCLPAQGRFVLYGPFRQNGRFNTDSNRQFDQNLKARDAGMGIRDLEVLDELCMQQALRRTRLYAMPANNHIAVWEKQ